MRWCWRRGSTPHGTRCHRILSPTRLPVPPLQRRRNYTVRRSCFLVPATIVLTQEAKISYLHVSAAFGNKGLLILRKTQEVVNLSVDAQAYPIRMVIMISHFL